MGGNWLITISTLFAWQSLIHSKKSLSSSVYNICLSVATPTIGNIGPSGNSCNTMSRGFVYAAKTPRQNLNPLSNPPSKSFFLMCYTKFSIKIFFSPYFIKCLPLHSVPSSCIIHFDGSLSSIMTSIFLGRGVG